jgi:hypothetical protein
MAIYPIVLSLKLLRRNTQVIMSCLCVLCYTTQLTSLVSDMKGNKMQNILIDTIKYNQVITVEVKNGTVITGHFRGVSTLVNNDLEITDRKIINLASTTVDPKQPEASILSNFAVNYSQVVSLSVNEAYADKVMKAMWQRSLDQVADSLNKIDWSKFDESLTMKEVEA